MFLTIETLHSRHFKPKDIVMVQYFFPYQRTPIVTLWPFRSTLQGKQTWLPFRHGSISCQVPLFKSPCGMWSCKRPCTWEDIHKHMTLTWIPGQQLAGCLCPIHFAVLGYLHWIENSLQWSWNFFVRMIKPDGPPVTLAILVFFPGIIFLPSLHMSFLFPLQSLFKSIFQLGTTSHSLYLLLVSKPGCS